MAYVGDGLDRLVFAEQSPLAKDLSWRDLEYRVYAKAIRDMRSYGRGFGPSADRRREMAYDAEALACLVFAGRPIGRGHSQWVYHTADSYGDILGRDWGGTSDDPNYFGHAAPLLAPGDVITVIFHQEDGSAEAVQLFVRRREGDVVEVDEL